MVAYNFKPHFAEAIAEGRKCQTIRAPRANGHAEVGDALQLFTGMRTPQCRHILDTICVSTHDIELRWAPVVQFKIDGHRLDAGQMQQLARNDGFADLAAMERFWAETHKSVTLFHGTMIRWRPPVRANGTAP